MNYQLSETDSLELIDIINKLSNYILKHNIDPRKGLPEELFLLLSSLTPIPNIDLLVFDNSNRILLSWRDDIYYGKGWHFIGGCIRMRETMASRILKTSLLEIGTDKIEVNYKPITVRDAIVKETSLNPNSKYVRSHNISVMFKCRISSDFDIDCINRNKEVYQSGYLKWFSKIPDNLLETVKNTYGDVLELWNKGELHW